MKRFLAVSGLLVAVVLPTACGSQSPTQARDVFSTQQVLEAFAKHGIRLQVSRSPWGPADQPFHTPGNQAPLVTADVLDPRDPVPYILEPKNLRAYREMDSRQRWARRGNVLIGWLQLTKKDGTADKIHAALSSLRFTPADAAKLLRPKLQLHPGESRTVDFAHYPQGTTVSCVSGPLEVDEFLNGGSRALNSDGDKTGKITLRRTAPSGSRRTYSCVSGPPTPPLKPARHPTNCASGPRTVRFAGLVARIPHGWYAATQRKQGLLWIASRPRCAVNWPTSLYGVYVSLRADSGLGYVPHGRTVRHFGRLREVMAHGHIPGAYSAELFSADHGYWLDVQMGARAVGLHGLVRVKSILRGVALPPSITLPHG